RYHSAHCSERVAESRSNMTFYRVTATESGVSTIVPPTRGWTSLAAGCCTVLGLTPAELADRVLLPNEYEVPELNLDLDPERYPPDTPGTCPGAERPRATPTAPADRPAGEPAKAA